jgi:hypothetical protein
MFTRMTLAAGAAAAAMMIAAPIPAANAMPAKPFGLVEGAPLLVETVQYRRRVVRRSNRGNAAGAAVALGVLGLAAGAAIAASRQPDYYEAPPRYGYYNAPPAYGYGGGYYAEPAPQYYRQQRSYYDGRQRYSEPRYYGGRRDWRGANTAPRDIERPDAGGK